MRAVIPGYAVGSLIGTGGFSSVYRAKQERFDREVALKLLNVRLDEPGAVRRFQNECRVLGSLDSHPHIADVFDAGTGAEDQPFIAMRLYPRGSVAGLLAEQGYLSITQVFSIGIQVAGALQAAHDLGVVHRDVKPQNILLTDRGDAALADFGVAIITQGAQATISQAFTYDYAAPEILESEQFSPASDQYALASTLYTLATGQVPFPGSAPASKIRAICLSSPDLADPRLAPMAEVLATALAKDPADRFPSAAEFGAALAAAKTAEDAAIASRKSNEVHTVIPAKRSPRPSPAAAARPRPVKSPSRTDPIEPSEGVDRLVGAKAAAATAAMITVIVAATSVAGAYAIYSTRATEQLTSADWLLFMGSLFVATAMLAGGLIGFSRKYQAIGYGIAFYVLVSRFKRDCGVVQKAIAEERPGAIAGAIVLVVMSGLALWLVARIASRSWVRSRATGWQTAALWMLAISIMGSVANGYWGWSAGGVRDVGEFGKITLVAALTLAASFVAIYVCSRLPNGLGLLGYIGAYFGLHVIFVLAALLELTTVPPDMVFELGLLTTLGAGLIFAIIHVRRVWGMPAVPDGADPTTPPSTAPSVVAPSVVDLRYTGSPTVHFDLTDSRADSPVADVAPTDSARDESASALEGGHTDPAAQTVHFGQKSGLSEEAR